jgi:hypothetical protein
MKPSTLAVTAVAGVVLAASAAWAGTKYQTSLVPADADNPTLSAKSKMQIKDKGLLQAKLQGITDGAGDLVTGDGTYNPKKGMTTLSGDEYVVVQNGTFPGVGNTGFQFNLVADVKKGKGKAAFDGGPLFSLIPNGVHRAVNVTSVAVYGPVGDQTCNGVTCPNGVSCTTNADCPTLQDCQDNLDGNGFVLEGFDNPCIGGELLGVGGILIP